MYKVCPIHMFPCNRIFPLNTFEQETKVNNYSMRQALKQRLCAYLNPASSWSVPPPDRHMRENCTTKVQLQMKLYKSYRICFLNVNKTVRSPVNIRNYYLNLLPVVFTISRLYHCNNTTVTRIVNSTFGITYFSPKTPGLVIHIPQKKNCGKSMEKQIFTYSYVNALKWHFPQLL